MPLCSTRHLQAVAGTVGEVQASLPIPRVAGWLALAACTLLRGQGSGAAYAHALGSAHSPGLFGVLNSEMARTVLLLLLGLAV